MGIDFIFPIFILIFFCEILLLYTLFIIPFSCHKRTVVMNTLFEHAKLMYTRAYAPYSNYSVGVAIQCDESVIVGGCHVESSVYGLGVCAERVAIFNAISQGQTSFYALALVTRNGGYPCGACRQIITEFCADIIIYICTPEKIITTTGMSELLPHSFSSKDVFSEPYHPQHESHREIT
jgi:cytidine deaminase